MLKTSLHLKSEIVNLAYLVDIVVVGSLLSTSLSNFFVIFNVNITNAARKTGGRQQVSNLPNHYYVRRANWECNISTIKLIIKN